jgi:hypothetical protein
MYDNRSTLPMWLGGILLALVLILISTRGGGIGNARLIQQFTPKPTDPGAPTPRPFELPQIHLPSVPPNLREVFTKLRDRLASGEAVPALTPVASGPRARVDVAEIQRSGDRVQIRGSVTNIAAQPLQIPPGAFSFRDSAGITYATGGSGGATLQPNQSTSFDLTVPLPAGRGLVLILVVPPDPALEQTLVVEAIS